MPQVPFNNASAVMATVCASAQYGAPHRSTSTHAEVHRCMAPWADAHTGSIISVRIKENMIIVFSSKNSSKCFIYLEISNLQHCIVIHHKQNMKKRSERYKHCTLAVVALSQKFSLRRRPLPGGVGQPKCNQLEMVTTFTYRPSLVKIYACNFELSW